jgi:hypothetical protein
LESVNVGLTDNVHHLTTTNQQVTAQLGASQHDNLALTTQLNAEVHTVQGLRKSTEILTAERNDALAHQVVVNPGLHYGGLGYGHGYGYGGVGAYSGYGLGHGVLGSRFLGSTLHHK